MDKDKAAAFIEEKRKEKGLTQQQVAEALHVTRQAVSKWENDVSYPDITLLKPLARAFGVSVDELSPRMFSFNNPYGACKKCTAMCIQKNRGNHI